MDRINQLLHKERTEGLNWSESVDLDILLSENDFPPDYGFEATIITNKCPVLGAHWRNRLRIVYRFLGGESIVGIPSGYIKKQVLWDFLLAHGYTPQELRLIRNEAKRAFELRIAQLRASFHSIPISDGVSL